MSALTALTQLCPPPSSPALTPDWDEVEATLGMRLPEDYKQLVAVYGPGQFCNFITIYQPHNSTAEWSDRTGPMPARLRGQIEEVRQTAQHPWTLPHNRRHLFAMGVTGNGDYLFWVTQPTESPDAWKIAVNEALRQPWFTYDGALSDFLLNVLSGTTHVPMFPKDLLEAGPVFTPARRPTPSSPTSVSPRAIREWAREHGYQVEDRGRIPPEIMKAWEQANPA